MSAGGEDPAREINAPCSAIAWEPVRSALAARQVLRRHAEDCGQGKCLGD